MSEKTKIIVVAGPTASGKTAFGIELAKALGGEIVSADSMQVYKDMPIATAAPTEEEKAQAPHHLTEFLSPEEGFSVAAWCDLARERIADISSRGKIPIIVGGTGLFIDSLVDNISFEQVEVDEELRRELMERDIDSLYDELKRVDPSAADEIHKNNKKRVVRALELYYSGITKTQQNINSKNGENPYDTLYLILDYKDRELLYDRINRRVDFMLEQGLVDEAKSRIGKTSKTSAQAIGHKELMPYINGEITLEAACDSLRQKTRNYAKRQLTWFRKRDGAVHIFLDSDRNRAVEYARELCEDFLNVRQ